MKNKFLYSLAFAFLMSGTLASAQNINNCVRANGSHGHVSVSALSLDTSDFTIELWIKIDTLAYSSTGPGPLFNDPSIIGNKNWTSGGNTGVTLAIQTGGKWKVNFTPDGISRLDKLSSGPFLEARWNHIAATFDRHGYCRMYSNGILTDSFDISAGAGHSIDGTLPYNIMDDGTGSYTWASFFGSVDEFRIWKEVRSTTQIQQYMCRTVPSGTPNLVLYYGFDTASGTTVPDLSGSGHTGTLVNSSISFLSSNAPVGDTSASLYATSYTGDSVMATTPAHGSFYANNIGSSMQGIHVYRTNYPTVNSAGITFTGTDSLFFGVYPVSETTPYQVVYNYSAYPLAVGNEGTLALYEQPHVLEPWAVISTTTNTTTKTLQSVSATNYLHFDLGGLLYPLSVSNLSGGENNIKSYPNPVADGKLNFESKNGEQVTMNMFNLQGALIKSVNVNSWPYTLDLSGLPAGSYYVNCKSAANDQSFKIVVSK